MHTIDFGTLGTANLHELAYRVLETRKLHGDVPITVRVNNLPFVSLKDSLLFDTVVLFINSLDVDRVESTVKQCDVTKAMRINNFNPVG